jgi:hypothetical protein
VLADRWSLIGLVKSTMVSSIARIKNMALVVAYSKTELIMKVNGAMIYVLEREVKSIETNMNILETT